MIPEPGSVIRIPLNEGSFALGLVTHRGTQLSLIRVNLRLRGRGEFTGEYPNFGKDWETLPVSDLPFKDGEWRVVATGILIPANLRTIPRWNFPGTPDLPSIKKRTFHPKSFAPIAADSANTAPIEEIQISGFRYIEKYLERKIPK